MINLHDCKFGDRLVNEEGDYDESLVYDIMDKCDAMTTGIVYEDEEIKVEICE